MIRLYRFDGCPFCDTVEEALAAMALPWEEVEVDRRDRSEVRRLSGQPLVPIIVDEDRVIADSRAIVRYLRERYGRGVH
ncbi:MAG: glutathione S-transferase N-terminal domain-containing protein [Acidobacteriota bacterium]